MNVSLNDLLEGLEKSAGVVEPAKTEAKPDVSAELRSVLEKKASDNLMEAALEAGQKVARSLLEKAANEITLANDTMVAADDTKVQPTETAGTVEDTLKSVVEDSVNAGAVTDDRVDPELDKKAETEVKVNTILEKIAQSIGEATTTPAAGDSVAAAAAPNLVQSTNAEMTAFDDQKVQPTPGTEGLVHNVLEQLVAKSQANGAGSDSLTTGNVQPAGYCAGAVAGDDEAVEKAAAVSALVGEGINFEDAVSLVKQAEEALLSEGLEQEKTAALGALLEQGVDFDSAVAMVKQAEQEVYGAPEVDWEQEKTAAMSALLEEGVDFDSAVAMVKQAEEEMRGGSVESNEVEKAAAMGALLEQGVGFDDAVALIKAAEEDIKKDKKKGVGGKIAAGVAAAAVGAGAYGLKKISPQLKQVWGAAKDLHWAKNAPKRLPSSKVINAA